MREDELQTFQLRGPNSIQVIAKVIQPSNENSDSAKVWSTIKYLNGNTPIKPGTIISMNVKDPRCTFPPKKSVEINQENFPELTKSANTLAMKWPNNVAASEIWVEEKRKQFFNKKLEPNEFQINQQREKLQNPESPLNPPILIIKRGYTKNDFGEGYDIILPAGWGKAFWRSLIYSGGHSIGLRDIEILCSKEASQPSFPFNYIDTNAYHFLKTQRSIDELEKFRRKPPSKRMNYCRTGTNPFFH
eukprot:TRINITY_DN6093_c0_g1_i1.p1 TRINITY_DN6093_c0_g1~~TRINITY_DN6093_c0_g1_i1.p1  ORF type:complete len:246 (-),score=61.45 TRINITY_DN6093_c0_g1_i1:593-1330(-)